MSRIVKTVPIYIIRKATDEPITDDDRRATRKVLWGVIEDQINDWLPPNYRAKVGEE